MAASNKVFNIPELLESILDHGLAKDLLLQQRVNKTWQGVIQGSSSIRRKLHYDEDSEFKEVEWEEPDRIRWNPLMTSFWVGREQQMMCCQEVDLEVIRKFDFPSASWKAMYITSPAMKTVTLRSGNYILGTLYSMSGVTIGKLAETQQEGSSLRIDETRPQQLSLCFDGLSDGQILAG